MIRCVEVMESERVVEGSRLLAGASTLANLYELWEPCSNRAVTVIRNKRLITSHRLLAVTNLRRILRVTVIYIFTGVERLLSQLYFSI